MSEHFLADHVSGESEFRADPWYNPYGDCIVHVISNEAFVARRVDEILTIYESAGDRRPIGFQIKGVGALIRRFGWAGVAVESEAENGEVVSISLLLLAAYEAGPRNIERRRAYADAFEFRTSTRLRREELVPA